jgi:hypothetical protein
MILTPLRPWEKGLGDEVKSERVKKVSEFIETHTAILSHIILYHMSFCLFYVFGIEFENKWV